MGEDIVDRENQESAPGFESNFWGVATATENQIELVLQKKLLFSNKIYL